MRGAAHKLRETDTGQQHRALSTAQVLEHWRTAPASLEMRARRLRRCQTMVAHQWRNGQILTSMFGRFLFEEAPALIQGDPKKACNSVGT
eukprot:6612024-Pyramimonas_sp.AAC.1